MRKLLIATALCCLPFYAGFAQTANTELTRIELERPTVLTAPTDVVAKFRELMTEPELADYPVDTVRLEGRANAEADPQQRGTIARMEWVAVSTEDGDKRVGLSKPLATDLLTVSPQLSAGTDMNARGDRAALIDAVKQLFGDVSSTEEDVSQDEDENATGEKEESQAGGGDNSAPQAGGGSPSNNVGNYDPAEVAEDTEADGSISMQTKACEPEIDRAAEVVYFRSATTITNADGSTSGGECQNSGFPADIKYNYSACEDDTDLSTMKITVKRKPYYINQQGENTPIDGCEASPEETHDIVPEATFCPGTPLFDGENSKFQVETELVYYDRNNNRQVVDDCMFRDGGTAYDMWETADGCGIRHNFNASTPTDGVSYQQTRWVYKDTNGLQDVTSCADSTDEELQYGHQLDLDVCTPIIDKENGLYDQRYQLRIDTPTGAQHISDCRPLNLEKSIEETFNGCETQHTDDFVTGQSLLWTRWRMVATGEAVTDCEKSAHVAVHEYVRKGWENNDELRLATEKLEVYIPLPSPVGRTLIDGPKVRAVSADVAYSYETTKDVETGEYYIEGCIKYNETAKSEVYTRPDTTIFTRQIGDGTPVSQGNDCKQRITWQSEAPTFSRTVTRGSKINSTDYQVMCHSHRHEVANLEVYVNTTGEVVNTQSNTGTVTATGTGFSSDVSATTCNFQNAWQPYPTVITDSQKRSFEDSWGW